ncbi:MAG: ATP-binding protein [Rhodocyclaceae bacterium]
MKALFAVAALAAATLFFLLTWASANSPLFARNFPLLIALNGAVVIGLLALVLYQLRGLWREYRERAFGSRLKYRLLLMFALMAVLPGTLVYAVSVQFVMRSIESWFDVRVDAALDAGINLGRSVLDNLLADVQAKAEGIAAELPERGAAPSVLERLREQAGVESATLLAANGQILASSSRDLSRLVPELPAAAALRQARIARGWRAVEGDAASGLTLRVLVPVAASRPGGEEAMLMLVQPVPGPLARNAEAVQGVYRDYQELSLARQGLKRLYGMTLTLALLLGLLGAIAFSFVLTRRLSAPLSILAEGTAAVASGDFSPRRALPARDELSVLTQSFNRMTRQLEEARAQAEGSRAEAEAARAHVESVLANLSAGVLAFDAGFVLRSANRGARAILGEDFEGLLGEALERWPRLAALARPVRENFAGHEGDWNTQVEIGTEGGMPQTLLVRGSRLPEAGGGGYVVVFDDITGLLAAQRAAAWGEVARRLAHEIKNPLTPIQLSAERLQLKLAGALDRAGREFLERSTTTIVNQVEAMKNMVNDFRDYARLPPPRLAALDLNALVREVLALYESSRVPIAFEADEQLPRIAGDEAQLRQVIHNLVRNSEDALEKTDAPSIGIATALEAGMAVLTVRDNGPGFAPEVLSRAFEPYVTTKPRGTGLGLAIVRKIVEEHHGEVRIANRSPQGAEMRIRLPFAQGR